MSLPDIVDTLKKMEDMAEAAEFELRQSGQMKDPEIAGVLLKDAYKDYGHPTPLKKGDLVKLKSEKTPYAQPSPDAIALVVEVWEPVTAKEASVAVQEKFSQIYREDILIFCRVMGVWVYFSVDSRYFEKVGEIEID
jgi:hypothetical protein